MPKERLVLGREEETPRPQFLDNNVKTKPKKTSPLILTLETRIIPLNFAADGHV